MCCSILLLFPTVCKKPPLYRALPRAAAQPARPPRSARTAHHGCGSLCSPPPPHKRLPLYRKHPRTAPPLPPARTRISAAGPAPSAARRTRFRRRRGRCCPAEEVRGVGGSAELAGAGVDAGAYLRAPPVTAVGKAAPVLVDGPGGAEGAKGLRGRRASARPRGKPGSAADGAASHLRGSARRAGPGPRSLWQRAEGRPEAAARGRSWRCRGWNVERPR